MDVKVSLDDWKALKALLEDGSTEKLVEKLEGLSCHGSNRLAVPDSADETSCETGGIMASLLIMGAQRGQLETVRALIPLLGGPEEGLDARATVTPRSSSQPVHRCTALNAAAIEGHAAVVRLLAGAGASVDLPDCTASPLCEAVFHRRTEVARLLCELGADMSAPNVFGLRPIHVACAKGHVELLELLVEQGTDVNQSMPGGMAGLTPLHLAAQCGCREAVIKLLGLGAAPVFRKADPDCPGYIPCPLFLAAAEGHYSVFTLLSKHCDCPAACKRDADHLMWASRWGQGLLILQHGDDEERSLKLAVHLGLANSPLFIGKELFALESPNMHLHRREEVKYQCLLVMERCLGPCGFDIPGLCDKLLDCVRYIVNAHRAIDEAERLMEALWGMRLSRVKATLDYQDMTLCATAFTSILSVSCLVASHFPSKERHCQQLVQYATSAFTLLRELAVKRCCQKENSFMLLLNYLLLFFSLSPECKYVQIARDFVQQNLYFPVKGSGSILHFVLEKKLFGTDGCNLAALLECGAVEAVNAPDREGRRPLHLCCHPGMSSEKLISIASSILLSYGAHLDAVDHNGHTPFTYSMLTGGMVVAFHLEPTMPRPLSCLAALGIANSGVPYKELTCIPAHLKRLIACHDKSDH